jgi:hypothetical protein
LFTVLEGFGDVATSAVSLPLPLCVARRADFNFPKLILCAKPKIRENYQTIVTGQSLMVPKQIITAHSNHFPLQSQQQKVFSRFCCMH